MAFNVNSIGRFAGSVTQGATEYAMTGNTTVNLLNFDMFGITNKQKQIVSSGLLEFNLGKSNNVLEIGTGGIRADYSTLASVAEGIYVLDSEKRIQQQQASFAENVNKYTDNNYTADEMGRLNRMMRAYGDLSAKMQAAEMLSNETDLKIGQNTDGKAQTVMENGKRTVYLNNDLDMNNQNSVFDAIVTLSHEARRDGTAGSESSQTRETRRAVGSHVDSVDRLIKDFGADFLFGNTEMFKDYVNYKKYGNEYVDGAYDSSADYWKLMDDGSIVFDGKKDLYDEEGNRIEDAVDENGKRLGWNASLAKFTGMSEDEAGIAMSKLGARWMPTERDEEGNIISLGHLYSKKEGVTLYDDPEFSFEASDSIFSKWLTDPTQKFLSTGEIQRERIAAYSQQDKETAWAGAPLDWNEDKGYCNIDTMIKGFSAATGVSEEEFVESLQQSWDDIRTETNDPDFTPDYININTGSITSYENFADALLGAVGLEDNYLFNYQSRKDSQGSTTSLALDLLNQGYKNSEIYMSGYYKHNNNGVLSGGHYAFIDMTGTLTNPFNGSSIWADDYQNQFMDLFTLQKIPRGIQQ